MSHIQQPQGEPTDRPLVERPRSDLHTGAEHPVDPEDLVMAHGQDPTEENVARARRRLLAEGPAAVEREVP